MVLRSSMRRQAGARVRRWVCGGALLAGGLGGLSVTDASAQETFGPSPGQARPGARTLWDGYVTSSRDGRGAGRQGRGAHSSRRTAGPDCPTCTDSGAMIFAPETLPPTPPTLPTPTPSAAWPMSAPMPAPTPPRPPAATEPFRGGPFPAVPARPGVVDAPAAGAVMPEALPAPVPSARNAPAEPRPTAVPLPDRTLPGTAGGAAMARSGGAGGRLTDLPSRLDRIVPDGPRRNGSIDGTAYLPPSSTRTTWEAEVDGAGPVAPPAVIVGAGRATSIQQAGYTEGPVRLVVPTQGR